MKGSNIFVFFGYERYKEYQLEDYSTWFLKQVCFFLASCNKCYTNLQILMRLILYFQLNNTHNWQRLKSCLVKSDDCNNLSRKYRVKDSMVCYMYKYKI